VVSAMPSFYFDESIHDRGGFIVGAFVYGQDADSAVSAAIRRVGLQPGVDEFKSCARMSEHRPQVALRAELRQILRDYRIGVVVVPSSDRTSLCEHAFRGLDQIARANNIVGVPGLEAVFDRGLFRSTKEGAELAARFGLDRYCCIRVEQDSRIMKGLQLADLVAHTAAMILLETLGIVTKLVKAGPCSGYDEDLDLNLGFEMWASLRYQFFYAGPVREQDEIYQGALMEIGENGLYIASSRSDELRSAALGRFRENYLGCIH